MNKRPFMLYNLSDSALRNCRMGTRVAGIFMANLTPATKRETA
jgi:hypothetical protein